MRRFPSKRPAAVIDRNYFPWEWELFPGMGVIPNRVSSHFHSRFHDWLDVCPIPIGFPLEMKMHSHGHLYHVSPSNVNLTAYHCSHFWTDHFTTQYTLTHTLDICNNHPTDEPLLSCVDHRSSEVKTSEDHHVIGLLIICIHHTMVAKKVKKEKS